METFHLFHLAFTWRAPRSQASLSVFERKLARSIPPPPTSKPTTPSILTDTARGDIPDLSLNTPVRSEEPSAPSVQLTGPSTDQIPAPRIRAAAAQMIFADRQSRTFISPERTAILEAWTGRAALKTICDTSIAPEASKP